MKKIFLLAAMGCWMLASAATPSSRLDSLIRYNQNYEPNTREVYTYDGRGNRTVLKYDTWDSSNEVWANSSKTDFTFNTRNLLEEQIIQSWNSSLSEWVATNKTTYTYNEQGYVSESVNYSREGNTWRPSYKYLYTYNAKGQQLSSTFMMYKAENWENKTLIEYTYDDAGNQTLYVNYAWEDGNWKNRSKSESTFNSQNQMLTNKSYNWNSSDWELTNMIECTYENGRLTERLEKKPEDGVLIASSKNTYSYDARGNIVEEIISRYSTLAAGLVNFSRTTRMFDEQDRKTNEVMYTWRSEGDGGWEYLNQRDIYIEDGGREISEYYWLWNASASDWDLQNLAKSYYTLTTGIINPNSERVAVGQKMVRDGQLYIRRGDEIFDVKGAKVE